MLGDRADADAVSGMVRTHVAAGALAGLAPDDLSYPLCARRSRRPALASTRWCGSDRTMRCAAAVLEASGQPCLDVVARRRTRFSGLAIRAAPTRSLHVAEHAGPLHRCVRSPRARRHEGAGRQRAAASDRRARRTAHPAVRHPGHAGARGYRRCRGVAPVLTHDRGRCGSRTRRSGVRQSTALSAVGDVGQPRQDAGPDIRQCASRPRCAPDGLWHRIDPDTFLSTLSGLDMDSDWTVRAAEAEALATLPPARAQSRLQPLLRDLDLRVVSAVLTALVTSKATAAEAV